MKKFDFIIGNPPYQDEAVGDQKNYAKPIYNYFIDEAYKCGKKVELIHPARFLFNAGSTPKAWNEKMLNDIHLKLLQYESNSLSVFPNADIMGGLAITYHDEDKKYEPIKHFVAFELLDNIGCKVANTCEEFVNSIVYAPESYKFTDEMHQEHSQVEGMLSKGHKYDFKSNVLEKLQNIIFFSEKPNDQRDYVKFIGLVSAKRQQMWIDKKYIKEADNFNYYKVFLPESNGSGAIEDGKQTVLIGEPIVAGPQCGHTQTFISIGKYKTKKEAENLCKYLKTRFARALLGILKITQHNTKATWANVPLQDFTSSSDIDWSKSIADIDKQLYKKYGLSKEEIDFIESHVKEMD
jgi:hypothetical protein